MRTRAGAAAVAAVLALVSAAVNGCSTGTTTESAQRPSATSSSALATETADRDPIGASGPLADALAGDPAPPTSPRQALAQLRSAERAVADPETPPRLLAAAGHTQQLVYRELADRPRWEDRVLAALGPALRRVVRDNVEARRAFRSMHPADSSELAATLPAWRIEPPLPAQRLRRLYRQAERRYGVEWEYLAAINLVETAFGRIRGTSVAGAQGPMQFIPTTWDIYGEGGDIRDPRDSIMAAARMLRANDFARDPAGALYRYNNHTAYVRGVSRYAEVMKRRPRAYLGYHQWPVYYLTRHGSVWLPEGYAEQRPVPVRQWLRRRG